MKWALRILAIGLTLLAIAAGLGWVVLNRSLPSLDGTVAIAGLSSPVTIERDGLGVPTITGEHRIDVARGLGFAHGQDRFFQMDLSRSFAAGELAELLGETAVEADKRQRMHRFRVRADRIVEAQSPYQRRLARAYAEGVNAGLASLGAKPFEYFLLGERPSPWTMADTILVVYSMYLDLNDGYGEYEAARGAIEEVLGAEMLAFLDPLGSQWDAPIVGEAFEVPPVPGADVFDLRRTNGDSRQTGRGPRRSSREPEAEMLARGSNNWAISGVHTADGRALLANDMHLGITVPNTWYRVVLDFPDQSAKGGRRRMTGVSLPGVPFVIAGSNGEVAWGFTNTWGDWADWVVIEPHPDDESRYRSPDGWRRFARFEETIRVKGAGDVVVDVRETVWGPILDRDHLGRERSYRWIAHDLAAVTFASLEIETASTVDEAVEIANRVGAPPQNFVVADKDGRIAWTVMGPIPRRFGHDGRTPRSWAGGAIGWDGYLAPEEYPRVIDPEEGRIWTANSRVVDGEMLQAIGAGFRLGARAQQIRDALRALENPTERGLLAVQLDDRALFLERWRTLLLEVLARSERSGDPAWRELGELVESWGGHASVDSAGYRLVRAFRHFFKDQVYGAILAGCKEVEERCEADYLNQLEGALWRLVEERPWHFLNPEFESWDEQFEAVIDEMLAYFAAQGEPLAEQTWGRRNTARIRHPMSSFMPGFVARRLDMPAEPLPGDSNMPRVQGPGFGASERLVVSPGREEEGFFHMPAGQSGHPLSPFYRAGHDAWVSGEATPYLPGETRHRLELVPAG
ncbi:MAG: penicillin acylase family protein [Thermoanaerobaculia bacterium]